jgi:hypothetical protein
MSRRWSDKEIELLKMFTTRQSPAWLRKRLALMTGYERSLVAVRSKIRKLQLHDQVPTGYVRPFWLCDTGQPNRHYKLTIKHARREGVLRVQKSHERGIYIVPEEWLDAFLARLEDGAHGCSAQEIRDTWLTTKQVGVILGEAPHRLSARMLKPGYWLYHACKRLKMRNWQDINSHGQPHYWHPSDVEVLARRYEKHKRTRPTDPRDNLLRNHAGSTIND